MDMNETKQKVSWFNRFLNMVERGGNKMPHPITLFGILALAVILISALCSLLGISATGMILDTATMELTEQTVETVSLLSKEGLAYIVSSAITNFTSYAPLGVVLVCMLGVGCAEGSGYLSAVLIKLVNVTPRRLITPTLVFLGIMSNVASDLGYVVLIPIGALIFMAYKRHPMAGLAAVFAGVSGGFSANLLIGPTDTMLSSISTEAAALIDSSYEVLPTSNWLFMAVSTVLITVIGTLVTDKIVEPRLGVPPAAKEDETLQQLSERESKALKYANLTLLGFIVLIVVLLIPSGSFLRNPETGGIIQGSPFMEGLVFLVSVMFFLPSVVYGQVSGRYNGEKDVAKQLGDNMSTMGGYIALAFIAAQFISYFNYSKLGTILALAGADLLERVGLSGPVLMVLFILLVAFINLFMGSASAKWTILAPVFVPMLMLTGYSPELTQLAYRIGDSTTNIISPLMSYFAMVIVYSKKYDEEAGIGTIVATMLPYSIFFLIGWSLLLVVWMVLGLPIGIGGGLAY